MADRILLCATFRTFEDCLALARQYALGLEIQTFAYPDILSGDWRPILKEYQKRLITFPGERAMHGPFIDMAAGSPDPLIREVVQRRVETALETAAELSARTIVFHANFISTMRNPAYRREFFDHQMDFWLPLAERAAQLGVVIVLENMWEFEPQIIAEVLEAADTPWLRGCLDVGHACLFSDPIHPLEEWVAMMAPYVTHVHINNNPGNIDEHQALDDGVIDYARVMPMLRSLLHKPSITLEMSNIPAMQRSLRFLELPEKNPVKGQ